MQDHTLGTGIAICTPVPRVAGPNGPRLAMITTEWHRARMNLAMPTNFNSITINVDGKEVGEARQMAVDLVMKQDAPQEFLFFLDYDVIPTFDCFTKLIYRARHYPEHDIFCGVYCAKQIPPDPLIYGQQGRGSYWDWSVGDVLSDDQVTSAHMGLTLIRTSLFERLEWDDGNPLFKTTREQGYAGNGAFIRNYGTEDLFFCKRAVDEAKARILVDTSVLAGHICHRSGRIYGLLEDSRPVRGAFWMNGDEAECKRAVDLGAGNRRRTWEGYRTYTCDVRADANPDHIMDTRLLNFPNASFDLVASNHHLEHIGRWDQEQVWREMSRILKPGGKMEHTVPNVEWAAKRIVDGDVDDSVMNVLYGGQEDLEMSREWNTHYTAYTPEILRAYMEEVAGLKDVEVKTDTDDPTLSYHMTGVGVKGDGCSATL